MDNMEQIVEMCRQAVADIIASVGSVGNLLDDENRMALIQMIATRLQQLGADVNAVLGPELANAYFQGMTDADAFLQTDGMDTTVNGVNRQMHISGVEQIIADTMQDMNASFRTALEMGIANIDAILDEVRQDIARGMILGDPSMDVAKRIERTFAQSGMTAFITKDNKRLPLDFYAQTVARTKYRVAHTTGANNRYMESGVYLVKINEHHPTCGICARYQGRVVALDREHAEGFPVANIDVPLPPYHPNCQHTVRPFVIDYHTKSDVNQEKKKWENFNPDEDPRTTAQKNLYKAEQDIRRKARQELKEYTLMKAELGDQAPKTLASYRRMKRKNDAQWKALQTQYRNSLRQVEGDGPNDRGTPNKRRSSKGDTTATGTTVAKATNRQTRETQSAEPETPTTPRGPSLNEIDNKALDEFDKRIDGIEFADRRKTSQFLIDKIPGGNNINIGIRKNIGANGYCASQKTYDDKFLVVDFMLLKNDPRSEVHQWKTMFHEYYHANMNGLDWPSHGINEEWTKWEETATETSAYYMARRSGIDVSETMPSYSNYLVEVLPRLKKMEEFADCETLYDFGAKFMKYRFNPETATGDWVWLADQVGKNTRPVNIDEYFKEHYLEHAKQNIDRYETMIFDALTQDNKFEMESTIRGIIRRGLESTIQTGRVNREGQMILPIMFNEIGVK